MLGSHKIWMGLRMVPPDLPTPVNTRPEHFTDISHEVIVELLLRSLDADGFHVFRNNIETFIREVEIICCPRHRRTELRDQGVDIGCQPIFERRIVSPMPDRALTPMPGVFINLRRPAHEPAKVVARVDVTLSSQP